MIHKFIYKNIALWDPISRDMLYSLQFLQYFLVLLYYHQLRWWKIFTNFVMSMLSLKLELILLIFITFWLLKFSFIVLKIKFFIFVKFFEAISNTYMNFKLIFCGTFPTSIFRFALFTNKAFLAISKQLGKTHFSFRFPNNKMIKLHHRANNAIHNLLP